MNWLVAAQHQVVHSYRLNGETARDSCLEDVDTCDLYVLILGHRYGFQPADGNPGDLSITHLKFRRAGQSGRPRVALLRTSIPDVSLSDMEDPQGAALVIALRDEVSREVRPAMFHDESSLIGELSTGAQAELEKPGKRPRGVRAAVHRAAGPGAPAGAAATVLGWPGGTAGRAGRPAGQRRGHRAAGGGVPPTAEGQTIPG